MASTEHSFGPLQECCGCHRRLARYGQRNSEVPSILRGLSLVDEGYYRCGAIQPWKPAVRHKYWTSAILGRDPPAPCETLRPLLEGRLMGLRYEPTGCQYAWRANAAVRPTQTHFGHRMVRVRNTIRPPQPFSGNAVVCAQRLPEIACNRRGGCFGREGKLEADCCGPSL
jgi:hypothetical protein